MPRLYVNAFWYFMACIFTVELKYITLIWDLEEQFVIENVQYIRAIVYNVKFWDLKQEFLITMHLLYSEVSQISPS